MKLKALLQQKRQSILDRWMDLILKTYPDDAARFMRQNPNRFGNPVGWTYIAESEALFDALVGGSDNPSVCAALDQINKIRAVQDFSPSRAVAYIFFLKTAIREVLGDQLTDSDLIEDLLSLESEIDGMALMTFDSYMQCRERLFEIKCRDIRRRTALFGSTGHEKSESGS